VTIEKKHTNEQTENFVVISDAKIVLHSTNDVTKSAAQICVSFVKIKTFCASHMKEKRRVQSIHAA
jgi:hypothetical protein